MTQRIQRGWRMMLGIWFLLVGVVTFSGCPQTTAGVPASLPGEMLPAEKELKSPTQSENSVAPQASEGVE